MRDIPAGSVDLLFSGQNVEHLFKQDLQGFLLEATRVLKPGAILCIDSPNRLVTLPCKYVQPEHVLELSHLEASLLLRFSGFSIEKRYGILDCRSSLDAGLSVDSSLLSSTPIGYTDSVDTSFIWWLVARKTSEPSPRELSDYINSLFLHEHPLFVGSRFRNIIGSIKNTFGTSPIVATTSSETGYCLYGPFVPLPAGPYSAFFCIRSTGDQKQEGHCTFDIVSQGGKTIHATKTMDYDQLANDWTRISVDFCLKDYTSGVEARVYTKEICVEVVFRSDIVSA
jgi:hypothetical protein